MYIKDRRGRKTKAELLDVDMSIRHGHECHCMTWVMGARYVSCPKSRHEDTSMSVYILVHQSSFDPYKCVSRYVHIYI